MPEIAEQLRLREATAPAAPASIAYTLQRSAKRRRTIEISIARGGEVRVAAPLRTPQYEIDAFVRRKLRWIQRAIVSELARPRVEERQIVPGAEMPYMGRVLSLDVRQDGGRGVQLIDDTIVVHVRRGLSDAVREGEARRRLETWYRREAQRVFRERVAEFVPLVGAAPSRVLVKTQKTRWGSCGTDGALRFNWTLIMAPLRVIDYLAVHELAHLKHNGHGRRFWSLVAKVLPDYVSRQRQLQREGGTYRL
jgi:predicted metal-dependent hydrolase